MYLVTTPQINRLNVPSWICVLVWCISLFFKRTRENHEDYSSAHCATSLSRWHVREPTAKTSSGLLGLETTTSTDPCVALSLSFAHYFYGHIVIFLFTSSCYENQYTYRDMRISSFLQVLPLSFRWDYKTRLVAKVPRSVKRTFASGSFPGFFFLCAPLPLSWTVSFPKLSAGKIAFYCTSRSYSPS